MRLTAVEAATIFAVGAGTLAVLVPSCLRAVRLSRTAEATENLERLTRSVLTTDPAHTPAAVPLTPAVVPRGAPASDPDGAWDHPAWKSLGFALDEPHWYAYRVDVDPTARSVQLLAHGDLDGDGLLSTYARTIGHDAKGWAPSTALVINADLE
jgi:hypothetical protein